jgi:hypothetical protein
MDFVQFIFGLLMVLTGLAIILSPELTTIITILLIVLGLVAIYDAIFGSNN